jgi:hypothetical protein
MREAHSDGCCRCCGCFTLFSFHVPVYHEQADHSGLFLLREVSHVRISRPVLSHKFLEPPPLQIIFTVGARLNGRFQKLEDGFLVLIRNYRASYTVIRGGRNSRYDGQSGSRSGIYRNCRNCMVPGYRGQTDRNNILAGGCYLEWSWSWSRTGLEPGLHVPRRSQVYHVGENKDRKNRGGKRRWVRKRGQLSSTTSGRKWCEQGGTIDEGVDCIPHVHPKLQEIRVRS